MTKKTDTANERSRAIIQLQQIIGSCKTANEPCELLIQRLFHLEHDLLTDHFKESVGKGVRRQRTKTKTSVRQAGKSENSASPVKS